MPWTAADLERLLKPSHRAHYPGGHEHPQKNHGGGGGIALGGPGNTVPGNLQAQGLNLISDSLIPQGLGAMNRTPEEIAADGAAIDRRWKPGTIPATDALRSLAAQDQRAFEREMAQADKLYVAGADLDEYILGRAQAIAQAPVAIRMSHTTLASVLADGRLKTQFETNSSNGIYDPRMRAIEEAGTMNVRPEVSAAERPVYGFLDSDLTDGDEICKAYGVVKLTLRPEVSQRATVTFGDSLMMAGTPIPVARLAAGQATLDDIARSGEFITHAAGAAAVHGPDPRTKYHGYAEVQVWGGVHADDIAKVTYTAYGLDINAAERSIHQTLGGRPIEYEVASPGGEVIRRGRGDQPPLPDRQRRSAATVLAW